MIINYSGAGMPSSQKMRIILIFLFSKILQKNKGLELGKF